MAIAAVVDALHDERDGVALARVARPMPSHALLVPASLGDHRPLRAPLHQLTDHEGRGERGNRTERRGATVRVHGPADTALTATVEEAGDTRTATTEEEPASDHWRCWSLGSRCTAASSQTMTAPTVARVSAMCMRVS